jgi:hypothetical protein
VTTKALNQAVKRNAGRFPADFAFQLKLRDVENLKSQIVTSSENDVEAQRLKENWSQFVTSSQKHRRSGFRPWVFAEHGALMAANVLRTERAITRCCNTTRLYGMSTENYSRCSRRLPSYPSAGSASNAASWLLPSPLPFWI